LRQCVPRGTGAHCDGAIISIQKKFPQVCTGNAALSQPGDAHAAGAKAPRSVRPVVLLDPMFLWIRKKILKKYRNGIQRKKISKSIFEKSLKRFFENFPVFPGIIRHPIQNEKR
jgi:hypothetical protein